MNKKYTPHITLLIFALLIGLIYSLPNIFFTFSPPANRTYLPFSFAETFYAAQAREILEGNLLIGDPQFIEHKNTFPSVFPYLPPLVLAVLGRMSGSIVQAFYLSDFLFPAFLFFVLGLFVLYVTKHIGYSIWSGLIVSVLYPVSTKIPPLTGKMLQSIRDFILVQNTISPLPFYRTPNTQLTYIVLLIGLALMYQLWMKPTRTLCLLTSVVGAILFSTYFYHATYFVFAAGCLFVFAVYKKKQPQTRYLFITLLVLGMVAVFYQYLSWGEQYQTLKITGGVFFARYPDWISLIRYGGFWGLLVLLRKRVSTDYFMYTSALTGAALICANFQLITGWTVQPWHWSQTTSEPTLVLVAMISFYPWLRTWLKGAVVGSGIVLLITYGMLYQIRFIRTNVGVWTIATDLFNVYEWLRVHGKTDEVATSLDLEINSYIHVLTPVNIYTSVGQYHYATLVELWQRMLFNYKLYNLPDKPVGEPRLKTHASFEYTYNVNRYHHDNLLQYSEAIQRQIQDCVPLTCANVFVLPKSVIDTMNGRYHELRRDTNPYRLDYAFYTPFEKRVGASVPPGKIVYQSGAYALYRVSHAK